MKIDNKTKYDAFCLKKKLGLVHAYEYAKEMRYKEKWNCKWTKITNFLANEIASGRI